MPPKRRKKTKERPTEIGETLPLNGDGEEAGSVCTSTDDSCIDPREFPLQEEEIDDGDDFEMKLAEDIENISDKNASIREAGLTSLQKILAKRVLPDLLDTRKETLTDTLEKCLKKGRHGDQMLSVSISALLCLQLGTNPDVEALFVNIKPALVAMLQDGSRKPQIRSACASALALIVFISVNDVELISEVMVILEKLFTHDKLMDPGLVIQSLSAWCLLFSIVPAFTLKDQFIKAFPITIKLLRSADVGLRMAAGECVALLYETARQADEDFVSDFEEPLIDCLQELATDGSKHRSKKDRKQQRSCFRDVLRTVEEGDSLCESYKFGSEVLEIESWAKRRQYGAFKDFLGSGINVHLKENELLRDVFQLGPPLVEKLTSKRTRREKRYYNAMAAKVRQQDRQKHRDKRAN